MLPYHGLGSGITRALEAWREIEFTDDQEGCQFTATVQRNTVETSEKPILTQESRQKTTQNTSEKTSEKILAAIQADYTVTIKALSARIGVTQRSVERAIERLKADGRIKRIGSDKGGHWEVEQEG